MDWKKTCVGVCVTSMLFTVSANVINPEGDRDSAPVEWMTSASTAYSEVRVQDPTLGQVYEARPERLERLTRNTG